MKKLAISFIFFAACARHETNVQLFEKKYVTDKFPACLSPVNEFYCDSPILRLYLYYKFETIIFCKRWRPESVDAAYYDDDKWFKLRVPECKDYEIGEVIKEFGE